MPYEFVEHPTVDTVDRASTSITTEVDEANGRLTFRASNNQKEGYTTGGNRTASKRVMLSVSAPTIDALGNITSTATATDNSSPAKSISKQSAALSLGANTADNLTANGPEVTADAGYYPSAVKKSVATASRGVPTIGVNKITRKITARVSQSAGYVSYGVENAEVDIPSELVDISSITKTSDDVTVSGAEVTTSAGYYPTEVKKSVATVAQAEPSVSVNKVTRVITARVNQGTGYVSGGTKIATANIPDEFVNVTNITKTSDDVTVSGAEVTTPAGYYPTEVKKSVPTVDIATPEIGVMADDEESEIYINAWTNQPSGYTNGGLSAVVGKSIKLKIEGDTAVMYDFGDESKQIRRKVGASIATCTVNITFSTNAGNTLISATTFANGAISTVNHTFYNNNSGQSVSIPNVVCGSALSINAQYMVSLYWSGSKKDHTGLLGGTITVPNTTGTYSVEIGVVDD